MASDGLADGSFDAAQDAVVDGSVDAASDAVVDGSSDATFDVSNDIQYDAPIDATNDVCIPTSESCDGDDDDCDGTPDNGFGLGDLCDGSDDDLCDEGMIVCDGLGGVMCDDTTSTDVELCNTVDDDCDMMTNEGFPVGDPCPVGIGACQTQGFFECNGAGTGVDCVGTPGTPQPEFCGDGIDQNCSGGSDPVCPINDRPAGAIDISGGGVFTTDLATAHDDDARVGTGCGLMGGRDVFYHFSLPNPEVVYADTFGSTFDTVLRIYQGSCVLRAGTPTCGDDSCTILQSQLAVQLSAGMYCLVVDQYDARQTLGALILNFVRGGRTGVSIAAGNGIQTGNTCTSTNQWTPMCQTSTTAPENGYFFTVCPGQTRTVAASTCNPSTTWDSVLYLRRAPTATDLACNDDGFISACGTPARRSEFSSIGIAGPGLFWLLVDGYQANCGSYMVSYSIL